jgi:hypothetical protein
MIFKKEINFLINQNKLLFCVYNILLGIFTEDIWIYGKTDFSIG